MAELEGAELDRKRGDTAPDRIVAIDPTTELPLDNTGFTYLMTLNTEKDPDPSAIPPIGVELAQLSGNPGGVDGSVEFLWNALAADQEVGLYWYDIEQTDTGGNVLTIAKNIYRIHMDVTKN